MNPFGSEVVVLGAGLQGAGVALELARRGIETTLIEQDPVAVNRASLRNEGKIHLGLIYANDASGETAFLQLHGALRFRGLLSRWIDPSALVRSTPFHYLVADDSVLAPDRLAAHYAAVEERCRRELGDDPELDYLGDRPERLTRALAPDEIARWLAPSRFLAGFATEERAIDCDHMAKALRAALARAPGLRLRLGYAARAVVAEGEGFRVEGDGPEGPWIAHARQVVNATWERRGPFDRALGLEPPSTLLHRLKYRVIARLPRELLEAPSVTMVLGRYGDVVVRGDGTAYLSWYPDGLQGWSHDLEPPSAWDAPCRGEAPADSAREIGRRIIESIDAWFPGIARSTPLLVDAGAIVALGVSDVNDAGSGLHLRSRIGVTSRGGYHSIDPGKLTTAPLFALEAADRIEAARAAGTARTPRSRPTPSVAALMPTWNAASFVAHTLDALDAQTWPRLEILISDDASTDGTADLCARHGNPARHPRRLLRQPRNLGWVGNVNALLAEARADYFLFAFQDDLPAPTYVERCVAALEEDPEAVLAFSDIVLVQQDERREPRVYDLLDGVRDRLARARLLARQAGDWWIPNRGVFRASAARAIGGLRRHAAGEFSADWPWLLHMSLLGGFVRVPERLCTKIYQPRSLSRTWSFGVRSWWGVTLSACGAVARAAIPAQEKLVLGVDLARFAGRHVVAALGRARRGETAPERLAPQSLDPSRSP